MLKAMKNLATGVALATTVLFASGMAAEATVIDFQSLEQNNSSVNSAGWNYSEDGYSLHNLGGSQSFATFGTKEFRYAGSTALFNNTIGGGIELVADNGSAFDLTSIDLSELNGNNSANVTFVGTLLGGGTVSQTFTLDGTLGFETFFFDSVFSDLLRVSWVQEGPFHQFDNIVINGAKAVPAPGMFGLLGLGLFGMVFARRRKV